MTSSKFLLSSAAAASLFAGVAGAADLPLRAAPPVFVPPSFTWTGGYLGTVVGVNFLDGQADLRCVNFAGVDAGPGCPIVPRQKLRSTGYLLGATSGYNLQFGQIVVGIESDFQSTDVNATKTLTGHFPTVGGGPVAGSGFLREQINAFGTVRGRLGYSWNRALIYVTGGVAYGNVNLVTNQISNAPVLDFIGHSDSSRFGGVFGGGVEYAFSDRWSAKVEGLYYDLGNKTVLPGELNGALPLAAAGAKFRIDGEIFRVGLNYKFGSIW